MLLAATPIERRCTVSPAKLRANQRNARSSTGPRTCAGKAVAARNARRPGLTLPLRADPLLARTVDDLARDIEKSVTGAAADVLGHAAACRVAETVIDCRRMRQLKDALLTVLDADPGNATALKRLASLDRYEGRAFARRKRAIRAFDAQVGLRARSPKRSQRRKASVFSAGPSRVARMKPSGLAFGKPKDKLREMRDGRPRMSLRSIRATPITTRWIGTWSGAKPAKRTQPEIANDSSARCPRSLERGGHAGAELRPADTPASAHRGASIPAVP